MASIIPKENLLLFVGIKAIETLSSKTRETSGIVILHFHLSVSVLPIEDTNWELGRLQDQKCKYFYTFTTDWLTGSTAVNKIAK